MVYPVAIAALTIGSIALPVSAAAQTQLDNLRTAISACTDFSLTAADWPAIMNDWQTIDELDGTIINTYAAIDMTDSSLRDINTSRGFSSPERITTDFRDLFDKYLRFRQMDLEERGTFVLTDSEGWVLIAMTDEEADGFSRCVIWHDQPDEDVIAFLSQPVIGVDAFQTPVGLKTHVLLGGEGMFNGSEHVSLDTYIATPEAVHPALKETGAPLSFLPPVYFKSYRDR